VAGALSMESSQRDLNVTEFIVGDGFAEDLPGKDLKNGMGKKV
jgi:hypothetical protein